MAGGLAVIGWVMAMVLGVLSGGAAGRADAAEPKPLRIVVSIAPLKGFATALTESLGEAGVKIETLIPIGVSEHGYEIPTAKLRALSEADIVVYVGRGLEPQVVKFLTDHPRVGREQVEFSAAVEAAQRKTDVEGPGEKKPAKREAEHKHDHGHDHDHGHKHDHDDHDGHGHGDLTRDPHLWLDPHNVKALVPAMRGAIERVLRARGELSAEIKAKLDETEARLLKRVDETDASWRTTLEKAPSRTIVVAHDAYVMLATRYHLKTVAIAGLTASEPTSKDIRRAIEAVKSSAAKVVFVEPQLSKRAGESVAKATGAKVLVLDPIGGDDWFVTMNKNLDSLAEGLGVAREK